jgi:hypothetical protein
MSHPALDIKVKSIFIFYILNGLLIFFTLKQKAKLVTMVTEIYR